jgi:hypothetical protein
LTGIRIANAPCSYGAFEITVGVLPDVPAPESVLARGVDKLSRDQVRSITRKIEEAHLTRSGAVHR